MAVSDFSFVTLSLTVIVLDSESVVVPVTVSDGVPVADTISVTVRVLDVVFVRETVEEDDEDRVCSAVSDSLREPVTRGCVDEGDLERVSVAEPVLLDSALDVADRSWVSDAV